MSLETCPAAEAATQMKLHRRTQIIESLINALTRIDALERKLAEVESPKVKVEITGRSFPGGCAGVPFVPVSPERQPQKEREL